MSIQEFLLARVVQDETETEALTVGAGSSERADNRYHRKAALELRKSVIGRHHDRSMTVMAIGKFETVMRCGICVGETVRPCGALKTMAQPYSGHPDYDEAWDLTLSCDW